MNKLFKLLRISYPYILIVLFIFLISNYYRSNKSEFLYLYNIQFNYLTIVIILCFVYLITESIILTLVVKHFKKKISFFHCFFIMSSTYLCNTFIQFSGLGFRAYYLNKYFDIPVKNFLILSLYFILVELFVFSFLGFFSIQILELIYFDKSLVLEIKIFLLILSILLFIGLKFHKKIINYSGGFLNIKYFKFYKALIYFFDDKKFLSLNVTLLRSYKYYVVQFFLLTSVFYIGYLILNRPNPLYLSLIASTFTDFSFIFTFTPYAIGISETFLFFSNMNFNLKISEILFLSNIFRLSMFVIYFPIGITYLIYIIKIKKNEK
jgi:uncharacterized membrane protein YbhN (UPF0104 family)